MRMVQALAAVLMLIAAGCGSSDQTGDNSKKITWEQFLKMPPEDQGDPYVLSNLDDDAQKKHSELSKKKRR